MIFQTTRNNETELIYENPNPNGEKDPEGYYNNAISKIEKIPSKLNQEGNLRFRVTLADDIEIPEGGKISFDTTGGVGPIDGSLFLSNERVGQVYQTTIESNEKEYYLKNFETLNEAIKFYKNNPYLKEKGAIRLLFYSNFKKYNKNRFFEFEVNKNNSLEIISYYFYDGTKVEYPEMSLYIQKKEHLTFKKSWKNIL